MDIPQNNMDIMVIDDTPGNLELLDDILSKRDYEARLFPGGKLAIKSAENDPPDLILLDVMMPEMDGYEVCQELKSNVKLKDIPIIFISAKGETFDKVKAFECGGVDYITKPFHVDEVIARVEAQLKLRSFHKALEEKNESLKNALHELAVTQNQLIHSKKMASLGILTAGIAHEINNPINFVYSGINILKQDIMEIMPLMKNINQISTEDTEALKELIELKEAVDFEYILDSLPQTIEDIKHGAQRTAEIIKGLRNFSRVDPSNKQATNIHDGIDSTLLLLKHKCSKNIEVIKEFDENVPEIFAFAGELNQVFMNLINNGIDTINTKRLIKENENYKGIIRIITKRIANNQIYISITDNGMGIPKKNLDNIFDPFFTTKPIGQGTGLGLAISHGIIEKHNGSISAVSKVGEGSRFILKLPILIRKPV